MRTNCMLHVYHSPPSKDKIHHLKGSGYYIYNLFYYVLYIPLILTSKPLHISQIIYVCVLYVQKLKDGILNRTCQCLLCGRNLILCSVYMKLLFRILKLEKVLDVSLQFCAACLRQPESFTASTSILTEQNKTNT